MNILDTKAIFFEELLGCKINFRTFAFGNGRILQYFSLNTLKIT